jgi:hypothetical protein
MAPMSPAAASASCGMAGAPAGVFIRRNETALDAGGSGVGNFVAAGRMAVPSFVL